MDEYLLPLISTYVESKRLLYDMMSCSVAVQSCIAIPNIKSRVELIVKYKGYNMLI